MTSIERLEALKKLVEECTKECVDDSQEILNEMCYHGTEYKVALEEAIRVMNGGTTK